MYQTIQTNIPKVKESQDIQIKSPGIVLEQCKDMANIAQESFQILTLNAKNKLIERHLISLGVINASIVHPREVLRACIEDSAVAYVAVHNHPSGDVTPSAEDVKITRQLIEASKIMDIPMQDHVIIGRKDKNPTFLSMREEGLVNF